MAHLRSIEQANLPASILTIGAFDGVHRGHQVLMGETVAAAGEAGVAPVVLTFFPHPSVVLQGRRPSFYLTTPEKKAELLGDLGVDLVITQEFNEELSRVTAEEFLRRLKESLGFLQLWVGPDFALGHQREGNIAYLTGAQERWEFELHVVEPLKLSGEVISSSRIREALRSGDVARAARYLGRYFSLSGTVQEGAGRGKGLGIPTANLAVWEEIAYPREGVYACLAGLEDGSTWNAVTNVGRRPTFEDQLDLPVIESHIMGYDADLYGQRVRLEFVERLRSEQRFESVDRLIEQIQADIRSAERILREAPKVDFVG